MCASYAGGIVIKAEDLFERMGGACARSSGCFRYVHIMRERRACCVGHENWSFFQMLLRIRRAWFLRRWYFFLHHSV